MQVRESQISSTQLMHNLAFRIRDSNEDDAELPLPQDDEKAKIPTWSLSTKPSRTHMIETNYELEKSAVESSNSKESFDIGLYIFIPRFYPYLIRSDVGQVWIF